jgi:sec-independent protein translocase protein TatA
MAKVFHTYGLNDSWPTCIFELDFWDMASHLMGLVAGCVAFCDSAAQHGAFGVAYWFLKEFLMGFGSWWHWVILLVVVLVLFGGKGKVSDLMGDVAKGIKSFKKGMADDPTDIAGDVKSLEKQAEDAVKTTVEKAKS